MAISKCIKCDGTKFELKSGSVFNPFNRMSIKVYFVQCASCGGVVSVTIPNELLPQSDNNEINE